MSNRPCKVDALKPSPIDGQRPFKCGRSIYLRDRPPAYLGIEAKEAVDGAHFRAEILLRQRKSYTVRWSHNGRVYSLMNLTQTIFQQFHPAGVRPAGMHTGWTSLGPRKWA